MLDPIDTTGLTKDDIGDLRERTRAPDREVTHWAGGFLSVLPSASLLAG